MIKIVVEDSVDRLDKFLSNLLDISRTLIAKMIEEDCIFVNGEIVKASYKVKIDDVIEIEEYIENPTELVAKDIPLDIIYEDADLMVINKQSGLTVHPGGGNVTDTLVNALLFYNKNLSDVDETRPGIVHRLDKDTSGLMLVAKNNKAHAILSDGFKNKTIKREYTALLTGVFPHETATIDAPIGRDVVNRKKMMVTSSNSKNAITHLKVIKRYKDMTLCNFVLETGRTHQIRVHAAYIGYPIYNDSVYNTKTKGLFGQYLHSSSIDFEHPTTCKKMHFDAPLPEEFVATLNEAETILKQEL